MLFTESQLNMNSDPMAVLNEATYLDENEALIRPQTIPIAENSRIGAYTVRFDDVQRLAESHGASYIDAVVAIAESSGVDPTQLKVAVDEAEIICNPDVILALPENGVVVAPLSENSLAFQYVTECIGLWDQMPDTDEADMALAEALIEDSYLERFIQEASSDSSSGIEASGLANHPLVQTAKAVGNAIRKGSSSISNLIPGASAFSSGGSDGSGIEANGIAGNPLNKPKSNGETGSDSSPSSGMSFKKKLAIAAGIGGIGVALKKGRDFLKSANNKPKSWIGQKIAALRKVYQAWMYKAQQGGPGVGAKIKQAAAKLLSIIDALMQKMQHAAG